MNIPDYDDEYIMFGMLFFLGNRLQVFGDNFYEEITVKQWFILLILETFGEKHPTLNELSDAIGSSHQNVKQIILKLEQKGYVKSYIDELDRRKSHIMLTEKCGELKAKYGDKQIEFMKSLFKGINSSELKNAVHVLIQLQENMTSM